MEGTHANEPRPLGRKIGKRWQKCRMHPGMGYGVWGVVDAAGVSLLLPELFSRGA